MVCSVCMKMIATIVVGSDKRKGERASERICLAWQEQGREREGLSACCV
jgi:hypothetical protein